MGYNIAQNDDGSTGLVNEATSDQVLVLDAGNFIRDNAQELTVTGAVTPGIRSVTLNHATVVVAATIADAAKHPGLFVVKNTSASGTDAHTLTLTSGTFDGTNNVATLNAPGEALVVYFDGSGDGLIVENIGTVALS